MSAGFFRVFRYIGGVPDTKQDALEMLRELTGLTLLDEGDPQFRRGFDFCLASVHSHFELDSIRCSLCCAQKRRAR